MDQPHPPPPPDEPLDAFAIGVQLGALAVPMESVRLDVETARAWLRAAHETDGVPFTALEGAAGRAAPRVALGIVGPDGRVRAARWIRLTELPAWLAVRHAEAAVVPGCP
ncbi:MAG: hypothetical protein RLZZ299_2559 [Pseudomonadota bacterium]|jgi:hypothetical protein